MASTKPCPFCASPARSVYENTAADPHYRVTCTNPDCDARGPRGPVMTDTDLVLWNERTAGQDQLDSAEKDVAVAQAVVLAEYVERQAKGSMRDAAARFLSLAYSREIAERLMTSGHTQEAPVDAPAAVSPICEPSNGLPHRIKAVDVLRSLGYRWEGGDWIAARPVAPALVVDGNPTWRDGRKAYTVVVMGEALQLMVTDGGRVEFIGEAKPYTTTLPPAPKAGESPWFDHAPVERGFYRLTCEENDGEVDVVLVDTDQYGILAALDTDFGTLAVSDFHAGLTKPRWQKMETGE